MAGDGEASTRFERSIANTIITSNIDELEPTASINDGHTTVQPAGCDAAIGSRRELLQREPDEGDRRGGPSKHVAEEDASVVVDPTQTVV